MLRERQCLALCAVQEKIDIARSVNPGYELTVHDDGDIKNDVKKLSPNFVKLFELLRPVEKADFWRYLIVYCCTEGGKPR